MQTSVQKRDAEFCRIFMQKSSIGTFSYAQIKMRHVLKKIRRMKPCNCECKKQSHAELCADELSKISCLKYFTASFDFARGLQEFNKL